MNTKSASSRPTTTALSTGRAITVCFRTGMIITYFITVTTIRTATEVFTVSLPWTAWSSSPDGSIAKVNATHAGSRPVRTSVLKSKDLAFGKKVEASSAYDADFRPEYAVDNNNGTLWRPATMGQEWLTIDLGKPERIRTVLTQWEYGTQFYQYLIETSADGKIWEVFADKRANRLAGSPMSDFGDTRARYVRITFTGGQKAGFPGAIWNVKVFPEIEDYAPQQWVGVTGADFDGLHWANNEGQLGGGFALTSGRARTVRTSGRRAVMLEPNTTLTFRNPMISPL